MHPWRTAAVGDTLATIMADGWPPLEAEPFGPWVLRASGGFTSRGNSVLVTGRPRTPLPAALVRVEQWYAARGLPALLAVSTDAALIPTDGELADALAGRGYLPTQPTLTMTVESALLAGAGSLLGHDDALAHDDVVVTEHLAARWMAGFAAYRPLPDDGVPERILTGSLGQRFLSVESEPEATRPVAVARMTMAPGWAGLHAMWVDPTQRRRGHAHRLAARIGQLAVQDGLGQVYLHVEAANTGARRCYRRLGFGEDSGYVYYRQQEQR